MSEKLSCPVTKVDDCVGDEVAKAVASMPNGSVCLLENALLQGRREERL